MTFLFSIIIKLQFKATTYQKVPIFKAKFINVNILKINELITNILENLHYVIEI